MGLEKYGDCTLVQIGGETILIDGGHPGDWRDRNGYPSIPKQLEAILGHPPPFKISLLVVTHCHLDHIGCLPKLVEQGTLEFEWALLADERLGFGRPLQDSADPLSAPDVTADMRTLVAALREESRADVRDEAALREFLADAATLESRYLAMIAGLTAKGTKIVRYRRDKGDPKLELLTDRFQPIGLAILGPTEDHLFRCTDVVERQRRDVLDAVRDLAPDDGPPNMVSLYRSLARESTADSLDGGGTGAAINNQSIALLFFHQGKTILLTGDMQFAKPEIKGLDSSMSELRRRVSLGAPYAFVKLAHHGSYNAVDQSVLDELEETRLVAISGGIRDVGHPDPGVLRLLKKNRERLTWARTDRNGRIDIDFSGTKPKVTISRGRLNSATPNSDEPEPPPVTELETPAEELPFALEEPPAAEAEALIAVPEETSGLIPAEAGPQGIASQMVEVTAKVPHTLTRVILTIDVQPGGLAVPGTGATISGPAITPPPAGQADPRFPPIRLGGGRALPRLLFVTNRERLARNIGAAEAEHALRALATSGHVLLDKVSGKIGQAAREVNTALVASSKRPLQEQVKGVVLVGGYDVIPSQRLDVLPPSLRKALRNPASDPDNFTVWSDDIYGCIDGDLQPELPVSRIPDGRLPGLVFKALSATQPAASKRKFGIRNIARPFAVGVYSGVPGKEPLLVSEVVSPPTVHEKRDEMARADAIYFMLHGADWDTSRFWGESDNDPSFQAITVANVPAKCSAVVFAGCCYGALPVSPKAADVTSTTTLSPRLPSNSMALAFLNSGSLAFVGCTGVHYSPDEPPYHFNGGPLHQAFWKRYLQTRQPAQALFEAKKEYLKGIPHLKEGSAAARNQNAAIELKIMRQYTCLGLGW